MVCPQCLRTTSIWRRGLFTGLCPPCRAKPGPRAVAAWRRWRRLASRTCWFSVAATFAAGLAAFLYCTPVVRGLVEDTRFSPEGWATGDARTRGRMVHDLMASQLLVGKSRDEVRRALGPPDVEGLFGLSYRYRVDVGYRWVLRPHLHDFVVRFYKHGHWTYAVAVEQAEPSAAANRVTTANSR